MRTIILLVILFIAILNLSGCDKSETGPHSGRIDVHEWSEQEILNLYDLTGKLNLYAPEDTMSERLKLTWTYQQDPILNAPLSSIPDTSIVFKLVVDCIKQACENPSESRNALKAGHLEKWLTPALYTQYINTTTQLQDYAGKAHVSPEGCILKEAIYINVLYALDYMMPVLEDLLDKHEITGQVVFESYKRVRMEEALLAIVAPLGRDSHSGKTLSLFLGSENACNQLIDDVTAYDQSNTVPFPPGTKTLTDSLQFLANYTVNYYQRSYDNLKVRRALLDDAHTFRKGVASFSQAYRASKLKPGELSNIFADVLNIKQYVDSKVASSGSEYIDIRLNDRSDAYFIRVHLKDGSFNRLKMDGTINSTEVNVSLVYGLHDGHNNVHPTGDRLMSLKGTVDSTFTELPLGLTIENVSLQLVKQQPFAGNRAMASDSSLAIKLILPVESIWNEYVYDQNAMQDAVEVLQIPRALGVRLQKIFIDPSTWQISFQLQWTPLSWLQQLAHNDPDFSHISIPLSELLAKDKKDFRHTLQQLLVEKITQKIKNNFDQYKSDPGLRGFFHASIVEQLHLDNIFEEGHIGGEIILRDIHVPVLNTTIPVWACRFSYNVSDGQAAIDIGTIPLTAYSDALRQYAVKVAREQLDLLKTLVPGDAAQAADNLAQALQIQSLRFDPSTDKFLMICDHQSYSFNTADQLTVVLKQLLENSLLDYKNRTKELVKNYTKELVADAKTGIRNEACDQLRNTTLTFYGLDFKINDLDCVNEKAVFTAGMGNIKVKGEQKDGKLIITQFDAPQLIAEVSKKVRGLLNAGDNVYLAGGRINMGELNLDIGLRIESLGFDAVIFTVKVKPDGPISVDANAIMNYARTQLRPLFSQLAAKISFGEYAGITLTFADLRLAEHQVVFAGKADFGYNIIVNCMLKIDYQTGHINCEGIQYDKSLIKNMLMSGLLSKLAGTADMITIEDITQDELKHFCIKVTADLKLWDAISLPTIRFTITRDKIDIDLKPSFTLHVVVPIVPPIVSLIDPGVELDLNAHAVQFKGDFSMGVDQSVIAVAKLVKVHAVLVTYYGEKMGAIDYSGELKLLSGPTLMHSTGQIIIPEARATFKTGTVGLLDKIVQFRMETEFRKGDTAAYCMHSGGSISILHIANANVDIYGTIRNGKLYVDGKGTVGIPVADLRAQIGTSFSPLMPIPVNRDSYVRGSADVHLGGFPVAGLSVDANAAYADINLKILAANLGAHLPGIESITPGEIIKILERLLASINKLPDAVFYCLTHPFDIHVTLGAPFVAGGGNGGDGNESQNDKGDGNGSGNEKNNGNGNEHGIGGGQSCGGDVVKLAADGEQRMNEAGGGKEPFPFTGTTSLTIGSGPYKPGIDPSNEQVGTPDKPKPTYFEPIFIAGHAETGYNIAPIKTLLSLNNVFFGWSSGLDQQALVPVLNRARYCGIDISDMYCVYYNDGKNLFIQDVIKNPAIGKFTNLLLMKSFGYYDPALGLALNKNNIDGRYYLAPYGNDTIWLKNNNMWLGYRFILGYNDNEAQLFTSMDIEDLNNTLIQFCNSTQKILLFDYFKNSSQISVASLNRSLTPISLGDGIDDKGTEDEKYTLLGRYSVRKRALRKRELIWDENEAKPAGIVIPEWADKWALNAMDKNEYIYLFISGNGKYYAGKTRNIESPFTITQKTNYFNESVDFAEKCSFTMSVDTISRILDNCSQTGSFANIMKNIQQTGKVERLAIYKLAQYFNLRAGGVTAKELTLCNAFIIPGTNIEIIPSTGQKEGRWYGSFIIKQGDDIWRRELKETDLTSELNIIDKNINLDLFENNKLFKSYFVSLINGKLESYWKLLRVANEKIVWAESSLLTESWCSFYVLSENDTTPAFYPNRLFFEKISDWLIDKGDASDYPDFGDHQAFVDKLLDQLLADTSARIMVGNLRVHDHPVMIAYVESASEVKLIEENHPDGKSGLALQIGETQFFKNLAHSLAVAKINGISLKKPRLNMKITDRDDIRERGNYIFNALQQNLAGRREGPQINPLSLFNKDGIHNN